MGIFRKKQHEQVRQPRISDENESYAFRRSRTMTGSLSNNVRAASESRSTLRSDRLKHHDLRITRRRVAWLLLGCLAAIVTLYWLLMQFVGTVTVEATTISPTQKTVYEKAINDYLLAHPGERFALTLNEASLTASVQQKYPEIRQVTLSVGGIVKPTTGRVSLRTPIATWTLQGKKYYIDEHGVAFTEPPLKEPVLVVEDNTGINPADAGAVASERMLHYIGRLVALVQKGGLSIVKIELPANTSRQINVYIEGRGYPVKTYLDRDPAAQASDVVNAVKYFDAKGIRPEYVDVRVSSKAYYK